MAKKNTTKTITVACKKCGSEDFIKKGTTSTARRFYCKTCKRYFQYDFTDLVGTPYERKSTTTTLKVESSTSIPKTITNNKINSNVKKKKKKNNRKTNNK